MPPKKKASANRAENINNRDQNVPGKVNKKLPKINVNFERYLWDFLGICLITWGLLLFVGLFDSHGTFLFLIVEFISIWIGWGILLLTGVTIYGGIISINYGRTAAKINWRKFVWIEVSCFITLAIFSIIGGNSIIGLESGWWGGRIGWSLVTLFHNLFGSIIGNILILLAWIISIISSFNGWSKIEIWLKNQTKGNIEKTDDLNSEFKQNSSFSQDSALPLTVKSVQKKKKILPEHTKTFSIPVKTNEKNIAIPERNDKLPQLDVLINEHNIQPDERNINQTAGLLEKTLADFGIPAKVVGFRVGPTITQFAVEPGFYEKGAVENRDQNRQKVRIAQIAGLSRDLALALSAERLRIEAPVPGRSYVGIEVPNPHATVVRLKPILESEAFYKIESRLALALGRDVSGMPIVADLARMPHLLIAGTTGSGKSVCISSIATCLAMNNSPEDIKMIMIDSKMVELIRFNGLPHLLGKVETNIERIMGVLKWVVVEMEHRYKLLEASRVRDLDGYNKRIIKRKEGITLPRIIVLIDELADLMMSAPDQTEHNLVRLAQMARATGIHLVVATQRPSADVVTGLIKANFPARISFAVSSGVDSRVILDSQGAETLLGNGDMLFLNPEIGNPIRAQGVLVSDQEIERVLSFWQKQVGKIEKKSPWENLLNEKSDDEDETLIEHAILLLRNEKRASASLLQRRLRVGYPRAARLLDRLEDMGIVGPSTGGGRDREVLLENQEEFYGQENED